MKYLPFIVLSLFVLFLLVLSVVFVASAAAQETTIRTLEGSWGPFQYRVEVRTTVPSLDGPPLYPRDVGVVYGPSRVINGGRVIDSGGTYTTVTPNLSGKGPFYQRTRHGRR